MITLENVAKKGFMCIFIRFSITGSISTAIDQVPKYTSEYLCAFLVKTVTFVAILELFY